MAAPSYINAGTGATDAGGAWAYTCQASEATGRIFIVQILQVGSTSGAISSVVGTNIESLDGTDNTWTALAVNQTIGTVAPADYQHIYIGRALSTSAPTISGANSTSEDLYILSYQFSNVNAGTTLSAVIENSTAGSYVNEVGSSASVTDTGVTTLGSDRMALNFVAVPENLTLTEFSGESGGNWVEVPEYTTASGLNGMIQMQYAAMASTGTINGGTATLSISDDFGVIGFALIGTTTGSTSRSYAQSQAQIKSTYNTWAQSNALIKARYLVYAQSLVLILPVPQYSSVYDTFTRTVSPGWGTSDDAGNWSSASNDGWYVSGGKGYADSSLTPQPYQLLTNLVLPDKWKMYFEFSLNSLPTSNYWIFMEDGASSIGNARKGAGFTISPTTGEIKVRTSYDSTGVLQIITGTPTYQVGQTWAYEAYVYLSGSNVKQDYSFWNLASPQTVYTGTGTSNTGASNGIGHVKFNVIDFDATVIFSIDNLNLSKWMASKVAQAQAQIKQTYPLGGGYSTIVRENYSSGGGISTGTGPYYHNVLKPTGTQTGDVLVLTLGLNGGSLDNDPYPSGLPEGWSVMASAAVQTNPRVHMLIKVCGASEPSSWDFNTSTQVYSGYVCARYSGVDNSTPQDVAAVGTDGVAATTFDLTGVTTVTNGAMVVAGTASNSSSLRITEDNALTEIVEVAQTSTIKNTEMDDGVQASAGPTGLLNYDLSSSLAWAGVVGALRPAGGMVGPTFAQAQTQIITTKLEYAQGQAQIQQTYIQWAQSQATITAVGAVTYQVYAQANTLIRQTYQAWAQGNSYIKVTDIVFCAQAQSLIKQQYAVYAQGQAQIKQTYQVYAQANAFIMRLIGSDTFNRSVGSGWGTSDDNSITWEELATNNLLSVNGTEGIVTPDGNNYANYIIGYSLLSNGIVQFDVYIPAIRDSDHMGIFNFDTRTDILTVNLFAANDFEFSNYNADTVILSVDASTWYTVKASVSSTVGATTYLKAWKRGEIEPGWLVTGHSDDASAAFGTAGPSLLISINATQTEPSRIDNLYIWTFGVFTPYKLGIAQALIKQIYQTYAQSQAHIKATYLGYAQSQTAILKSNIVFAQSQALVKSIYQVYAQALASIKASSSQYAQAQTYVEGAFKAGYAQTLGLIGRTDNLYTAIDESILDNTDYIVSDGIADNYVEIALGSLVAPDWPQDHILHAYIRSSRNTSASLYIDLYEGATVIRTDDATINNSGWVYKASILTQSEINSITDYSNLRVRFTPSVSDWRFMVSQVYLQVPSGSGIATRRNYAQAQADIYIAIQTVNQYSQAQTHILRTEQGYAQAQGKVILSEQQVFAQAQTLIRQTYHVYAQANAKIILSNLQAYGQAQAQIKQTYKVWAQSNAKIILSNLLAYAQAQSLIRQTYFGYAQANAYIKTTEIEAFAQAQATIKATYYVYANAQALIKATYQQYAQAESRLIAFGVQQYAQAAAWIEGTLSQFAQSQAKINAFAVQQYAQATVAVRQTYQGYATVQALIKQSYQVVAQAQTNILQAYFAYAQAQATIKQTYIVHAQAQAQIKATYQSYAQAQANIIQTYQSYAQSQASIKSTYFVYAQANAYIKVIEIEAFAQAQAQIKQTYNSWAQANTYIRLEALQVYGQAQTLIRSIYTQTAQANAYIYRIEFSYAQAQANIIQIYYVHAQAETSITQTYLNYAQAQARITGIVLAYAQAQAKINAYDVQQYAQSQAWLEGRLIQLSQAQAKINAFDVQQYAQADALIRVTYQGYAQSQAQIEASYLVYSQAQAQIKQTYLVYGQAQAQILTTYQVYAQALSQIRQLYQSWAQALGIVRITIQNYAQSQAQIKTIYSLHAQAQATVKSIYQVYAQAEAYITVTEIKIFAQAQVAVVTTNAAFAQSQVNIYLAQYARPNSDILNDGWEGTVRD